MAGAFAHAIYRSFLFILSIDKRMTIDRYYHFQLDSFCLLLTARSERKKDASGKSQRKEQEEEESSHARERKVDRSPPGIPPIHPSLPLRKERSRVCVLHIKQQDSGTRRGEVRAEEQQQQQQQKQQRGREK